MLNIFKINAKAIAAFFAGIVLNAVIAVINGAAPWPKDLKEWGQYLLTSLVAGLMVWATGNKITPQQISKNAIEQGISVITTSAIDQAADAAQSVVMGATRGLPDSAEHAINGVAQDISNVVTNTLKEVAINFPSKLNLKNVL